MDSKHYWFLPNSAKGIMTIDEVDELMGFSTKITNFRTDKKNGNWKYNLKITGDKDKVQPFLDMMLKSKMFKLAK